MQKSICKAGIPADTVRAFSFDILPEVVRDLKVCELVKKENQLLNVKSDIQQRTIVQIGSEKMEAKKQLKKEKRKRKVVNAVRTVIEVVVIIVIVTL